MTDFPSLSYVPQQVKSLPLYKSEAWKRYPFPVKPSCIDHRGGSRGRVQGVRTPPPPEMTCGFLIQLVFCKKKKTMWFIGVEVKQETSTPPPKKNPGSAPGSLLGITPSPLRAWIIVQKWLIDILLLDFVVPNVYLLYQITLSTVYRSFLFTIT